MKEARAWWALSLLGLLAGVPIVVAFSSGAESGYSGGPEGSRANCTTCHTFNHAHGGVTLTGVPKRYLPGAFYELTVLVSDPEQSGAGFEISAEGAASGHQGTLVVIDTDNTRFTGVSNRYITHTATGFGASIADWTVNGGSYSYQVGWWAPLSDVGPITFYAAGNAVDNSGWLEGDRFYFDFATSTHLAPGDSDGDRDLDLRDFAAMQNCFSGTATNGDPQCAGADFDRNGTVSLLDLADFTDRMTGPTSQLPPGLVGADAVRGGQMYDKWWPVIDATAPSTNHPLWSLQSQSSPPGINARTGADTWRCKECHGWDYKGEAGAYGTASSHYTGFAGVLATAASPESIFDLLKEDDSAVAMGHGYGGAGLTDEDIWNLVAFVLDGTVDTDPFIDTSRPDGPFVDTPGLGIFPYSAVCAKCHGSFGNAINFGTVENPEFVGTVAKVNPWEFVHKVRFGHPGSPMPPGEILRWDVADAAEIGEYAQDLPVQ